MFFGAFRSVLFGAFRSVLFGAFRCFSVSVLFGRCFSVLFGCFSVLFGAFRCFSVFSRTRIFLFVSILLHHVPYIKTIVIKYAQISTHVHLYKCMYGGGGGALIQLRNAGGVFSTFVTERYKGGGG